MTIAAHHAQFQLSVTKALADQLDAALRKLTPTPLTAQAVKALPNSTDRYEGPGVYQLYLDGERVYVGKASKSLAQRLRKHQRKFSGRPVDGQVTFVCLFLDEDLEASAPEKMLLGKYEGKYEKDQAQVAQPLAWNNNGFGNNDPGRRRDKSLIKQNHFDFIYPINVDFRLDEREHVPALNQPLTPGRQSIGSLLAELKQVIPYNLRYQNPKKDLRAKRDFAAEVDVPAGLSTFRDAIELVIGALDEGWQATALPGYAILYPEHETYESATTWWRRVGDTVVATPGPMRAAPADVIEEAWDPSNGPLEDEPRAEAPIQDA